jgi:hypothetical protein
MGGRLVAMLNPRTNDVAVQIAIENSGCTNIHFVPAPNGSSLPFANSPIRPVDMRIRRSIEDADLRFFMERGVRKKRDWYRTNVWEYCPNLCPGSKPLKNEEVPSLLALAARQVSGANMSMGMINGRPRVVSAMDNVESEKGVAAMALHARPTDVVTPSMREALGRLTKALDVMYSSLGTSKEFQQHDARVSLERIKEMYLGASAGSFLEKAEAFEHTDVNAQLKFIKKASQKKIHSHEATINAVIDFLAGDEPIQTIFTQNYKNEQFFSRDKQARREAWEKFINKIRVYEIPNEFFILLERLSQTTRILLERAHHICIGMKWSRGGAWAFAKKHRMTPGREWKRRAGDGDFEKLDQNLHSLLMNLLYSLALVYFKPGSADYEAMKRMIEFLAETVSARLVRFVGRLWAIVIGKMPSGTWATSHGDSFIVLIWYMIFGIMQIEKMPEHLQDEALARLINLELMMTIYGDDHLGSQDRDEIGLYFSETEFAAWCNTYFGVAIRDLRNDVRYIVRERNGYRKHPGIIFLRQNFVRNKDGYDETPYLPFREMDEYITKAVHGRETKDRDIFDFILSLLGHSYGTYASNFTAYSWLKNAFTSSVTNLSEEERTTCLGLIETRCPQDNEFVKKMRQADIAMTDLINGFPRYETLKKKNVYDEIYHSQVRLDHLER